MFEKPESGRVPERSPVVKNSNENEQTKSQAITPDAGSEPDPEPEPERVPQQKQQQEHNEVFAEIFGSKFKGLLGLTAWKYLITAICITGAAISVGVLVFVALNIDRFMPIFEKLIG